MDKIILFTSYFCPKNEIRQKEIDDCLQKNINNPLINEVYLFLDDKFLPKKFKSNKVKIAKSECRPTYKDYIEFINKNKKFETSYNIISNTDIYFDESLKLIRKIEMDNTCIVLDRWDVKENGGAEFIDSSGSQDVWIFKGKVKEELGELSDFPLGKGCCDNVFLYNIFITDYYAGCPALDIKAYHLHISKYRTYQEYTLENGHGPDRVLGNHMYIAPTGFQKVFRKEYYDTHHPLYLKKHRNDYGFKLSSEIILHPWNLEEKRIFEGREKKILEQWKKQEEEIFMYAAVKRPKTVSLFTSYWNTGNEERQEEILLCLENNIRNQRIDKIYLLCETELEISDSKVKVIPVKKRPTYNDFFKVMNEVRSEVSILANADIYFDDTLEQVKYIKGNDCFALSRWDDKEDGQSILYDHADSQDVWIFRGIIHNKIKADFEMGQLGCDNRLAHELYVVGYGVSNPAFTIRAHHVHKIENKHAIENRVPEPYKHVHLKEIVPFLSIVTRHYYKRPWSFKQCCDSVLAQDDQDYEHVVIRDDVGIGSHKANRLFVNNMDEVNGRYVFMLDDDDMLTNEKFISDLKEVVEKHDPDIIFVKMLAGKLVIPTEKVWGKEEILSGHVGTSCVVVKNSLWKECIDSFSEEQIGDFRFIQNVFEKTKSVVWLNELYSKTIRVSNGAPEMEVEMNEKITGLVVTHNTKELIERAYNSVRRFHHNMKIIIIDGSSGDNPCYNYVESLADENTRVFHAKTNIGHGHGLSAGIEYVDTPYVLIFDSDVEVINSPVEEMLKLMEDDTWGVGYSEPTDIGGHEWGSRKGVMTEGPMKYLHPYFCLIQVKEYRKYSPFIHHGAPAVQAMLDIYRRGLSDKVLKEFEGLGHTSSSGWTWKGKPSKWVRHDTRGTRDVVKKRLKKEEIEGKWDKIIDLGPQIQNDENITCITCTGDRLLTFSLCKRWIENQTVKPKQWIIVDDGKTPLNKETLPAFAKYVRREPQSTDPKHTMILNMKEAIKHIEGDKIIIWEDDEYYAPKYIEVLSKKLDQYEIVGVGRSKYYHLANNTYHAHPNMGHASLAQTCFRKSFLQDFIDILDGDSFLDIRIWKMMNGNDVTLKETGLHERVTNDKRGLIFSDKEESIYVGMKGLPGRDGIGAGHKGMGTKDSNREVLRKWIVRENDFGLYKGMISSGPVENKVIKPVSRPVVTRPATAPQPSIVKQQPSFVRRPETLRRVSTISRHR